MKKNQETVFFGRRKWEKILFVMKLKLVLILISSFQLSAAVYSQNNRLTLKMEDVSLEQVIWEIQKQTDFVFMYGTRDIAKVDKLTVDMTDKTVNEILDQCLRNSGLIYEISGNAVIIKRADDDKKEMVIIKGTVKDTKGEVLPGVTIIEKGTSVGVATGINGDFTFTTTKKDSITLVFSFVGMKTKSILRKGQKTMNVVLEDDAAEMDEVVVTGYQTVKKSNMAGSVSTISADDLILNGTQSLEQALQGKLPGVVITNQDGLVGTRQKVRVRGTSTLLGSQDPVWVVDGMVQQDPLPFKASELTLFGSSEDNMDVIRNFVGSAIAWLNPSDIKDVTVLKDASATAIYGVKAANGVIVITTKRGQTGKTSISYSGNFSIGSKVTYDRMNLMNSKERVDVSREIYERGLVSSQSLTPVGFEGLLGLYLQEKINYAQFNEGVKKLETVNTDWFDLLFENPFSHRHNVSISGGSNTTTYYASFGINKTNGTAKGNDSESYSGSISVNTKLWEKLQFDAKVSGNIAKTKGFNKVSPYSYAATTSRVISAFDDDGDYFYYIARNGHKYNVLNELENSGNRNTTSAVKFTLQATWEILKGLKFESSFGYDYSSAFGDSYVTEYSNYIANIRGYEFGEYLSTDLEYKKSNLPHGGELVINENRKGGYTWRNQFSYVKNTGLHLFTALIGQEVSSTQYDGLSETRYGYIPGRGKIVVNPPLFVQNSMGDLRENSIYNQMNTKITDNKKNELSFYSAFTYTYDERYVLNATIRTDASNRFGQDKSARYQPVWSVGLRWNMGREHFFEGQNFLNEFSVRATFGYQGNVSEGAGPDLIAYMPSGSLGISNATGEYLIKIQSLPNPKLKWEKNKTIDLGIDFVFWKSKISGTFEYYWKKGTDIIVAKQVPFENGIASMPMNGGTMTNSGWEFNLSFAPVRTKDFLWSVGFNTSKNYNELTSTLASNKSWQMASSGSLYKKGYPVSGFWAFEFSGLNPENGNPVFDLSGLENNPLAETDATEYMKYMGKLDPDLSAGLSTSFRYKSLTLSASFNMQLGGKKFLSPMFDADMTNSTPNEYKNMPKDIAKRWRKPGDEAHTNVPSLPEFQRGGIVLPSGSDLLYRMYNFSDIRVAKASFLRCNNITLDYNLPPQLISKFARNIGLSFSVSNPFMIVSKDFKGKDPEVATGKQPITQNYTLSVNVSF